MDQLTSENENLSRGLKNRHVQLLAIGGAIGTGLFLGSGICWSWYRSGDEYNKCRCINFSQRGL